MIQPIKRSQRRRSNSWQTIYMDLMTNIMVFFIILWSLNQGKTDGVSDTVGDTTSRMINLPGDVLFGPGQTQLLDAGKSVVEQLFHPATGAGLDFETSGLVKRMLMINGHTDSDGDKDNNLQLGFERAYAAYKEISLYQKDLPNHVIICTHADNTSEQEIPQFQGKLTRIQREIVNEAKRKNRRITIEDRMLNRFENP
ncbi:MAG: OmpA/MotB family protein [Oligoflexus sp.]